MDNLIFVGVVVGAVVLGLLIIGLMLTKLYRRASKEQAFVRTGLGGELVVKDGGALILPVFHDTIAINMKTLRLPVSRRDSDALITKDRLRVDVAADFYVRVKPDAESISIAAQTLGQITQEPAKLKELIEAKFVDALRSVAASMDMQDLHEKRSDFVQQVQNTVAEDLTKNGLELESVSLTGLDQTDQKFLNAENAFDAEGLTKLKGITEDRRKVRNEIEADARVAIEQKNLDAEKRSLAITQEQELARLEQERLIETQRAEQEAQLAQERAERKRQSDTATIEAEQATARSKVEREQETEVARVSAKQALQIAEQTAAIAVSEKSQAESEARAKADLARAEAVTAAQSVITAEATARADRDKKIAIIAAEQQAEQGATKIRIEASAEKAAAEDRAAARQILLDVEAREFEVRAEGERALIDAKNVTDPRIIEANLRSEMIRALPGIIEAQYRPMEKVGDIRMLVAPGGIGGGGGLTEGGYGTTGNVPGDLAAALMNMRMQSPMIDAFTETMGFDLTAGSDGVVAAAMGTKAKPAPTAKTESKKPASGDPFSDLDTATIRRLAGIPEGTQG
jgi:uncharacterized membrane protein YqiK